MVLAWLLAIQLTNVGAVEGESWWTQMNLVAETRTTVPATEEAEVTTTTPVLEL